MVQAQVLQSPDCKGIICSNNSRWTFHHLHKSTACPKTIINAEGITAIMIGITFIYIYTNFGHSILESFKSFLTGTGGSLAIDKTNFTMPHGQKI